MLKVNSDTHKKRRKISYPRWILKALKAVQKQNHLNLLKTEAKADIYPSQRPTHRFYWRCALFALNI